MLTYNMSKRGEKPIYIYLYECIVDEIVSGCIPPGTQLPANSALAGHLNISRVSVMGAYDQLLTEGYIYAEERRGYFTGNLENFRKQSERRELPELHEPEQEQSPAIDFKANRISLEMFPSKRWEQCMRQALSLSDDSMLHPVPYCGMLVLRRAIADYLLQHKGMRVSPAQIVIGAGTEYLYSRLLHLFPSDSVLALENPGYNKFQKISTSYGRKCVFIPIDEKGIPVQKLERSGADIVHISPANHFPTGIVTPVSRRVELFRWANRARERYIIEDDYDSEFRHTGNYIPPMYSLDINNKVIYINSFSKTLVPSIRISYMVLPPKLMQRYADTLSFYTCTASSFEQYALSKFLADGFFERHLNRLRKYYREQRTRVLDAVNASPLARIGQVWEEKAGTHFLIHLRSELSEEEIRKRGLSHGLQLSFLSDFYSDRVPTKSRNTLVFNYAGITPEQIEPILRHLEQIFETDIQSGLDTAFPPCQSKKTGL